MAQLKASVLKAQGRHDVAGMELTARSVGEPNDGAVLRAAMVIHHHLNLCSRGTTGNHETPCDMLRQGL